MRTYGICAYGLYIKVDELKEAAEKADLDVYGFIDTNNTLVYYSDTEGDAYIINSDDSFETDASFCIALLDRGPSLFSQAYQDYDEALNELKTKCSDFLPEGFDYKNRFVFFIGSITG